MNRVELTGEYMRIFGSLIGFFPVVIPFLALAQADESTCTPQSFGYFTAGHGDTQILNLGNERDIQIQIKVVFNSDALKEPAAILYTSNGVAEKTIVRNNSSLVIFSNGFTVTTKQFPPLGSFVVSGCYRLL